MKINLRHCLPLLIFILLFQPFSVDQVHAIPIDFVGLVRGNTGTGTIPIAGATVFGLFREIERDNVIGEFSRFTTTNGSGAFGFHVPRPESLAVEGTALIAAVAGGWKPGTAMTNLSLQADFQSVLSLAGFGPDLPGLDQIALAVLSGISGIEIPTLLSSEFSALKGAAIITLDRAPEPPTFALVGLGFMGLLAYGWRLRLCST